ncbi:ribonuclease HIII [Paucilactobacillus sp. N302-9]
MQQVFKVSPKMLAQMKAYYQANTTTPPAGALFRAKKSAVTITGYQSGKVMFQGTSIAAEIAHWHLEIPTTNSQKTTTGTLPAHFDQLSVIGSDEVGTGSYFGPLTVAATFVTSDQVAKISAMGIQDSKKLTDPQIIKMAKELLTMVPYHVVNLMPSKYNALIKKYNQGQLKALCHNLALQKVLQKIAPTTPDAILIDQFVAPSTYYRYLKGQSPIVRQNVFFQVRGEQAHVAVAAASIIARYVSLQAMDELTDQAGMTLPIGAGNAVDQIAAQLLHQGADLSELAKLHFQNTQKAQEILRKHY